MRLPSWDTIIVIKTYPLMYVLRCNFERTCAVTK